MENAKDLYIQFCGSWIIGAHTPAANADLAKLPNEGGNNGRKFALFLQRHKLGKRVSNITNLMPELAALATNY